MNLLWLVLTVFDCALVGASLEVRRRMKGAFDNDPTFVHTDSIQATAANPWPHTQTDNLCAVIKERNLTVTIVMAMDRNYENKTKHCMKEESNPLNYNTKYADANGYALRVYIDEDIPFVMKHSKNALQGELRKIFALADAMRPSGPMFGRWTSQLHHILPDLVMWVDGDAHIIGFRRNAIRLEEVVRRSCQRAEWPENYVRIIGQDSGNNVNAGWYILSSGTFGSHFLKYILELFEIYGPCEMWGQHVIQEALLMVMAGTPPPWPMVLPCSGELFRCFTNATATSLLHNCNHDKECFLSRAAAHVNATTAHHLSKAGSTLNTCFSHTKFEYAPNARPAWVRYTDALEATRKGNRTGCNPRTEFMCCHGLGTFSSPGCTGAATGGNLTTNSKEAAFWGAAGAGVVLLPETDPYVKFNSIRAKTHLLWHHGHGRVFDQKCTY